MLSQTLSEIFKRDLNKLKEELSMYADERKIWEVRGEIANSAGNLALHLIGNLNHFIGAVLGNSGYVREREMEFSTKGTPRAELLAQIDALIPLANSVLQRLSPEELEQDYPLEKHGQVVTTAHMLLHLFGHLSYHLGQINYHRRLVS
jgi:uncharacterized damage-inducible protein DinB